jgi:hypothetical protein
LISSPQWPVPECQAKLTVAARWRLSSLDAR